MSGKPGSSIAFAQENEQHQQGAGRAECQDRHPPLKEGIIRERRVGMQRYDQAESQPDQHIKHHEDQCK